jgi:hypothetical protein
MLQRRREKNDKSPVIISPLGKEQKRKTTYFHSSQLCCFTHVIAPQSNENNTRLWRCTVTLWEKRRKEKRKVAHLEVKCGPSEEENMRIPFHDVTMDMGKNGLSEEKRLPAEI